MTTSEQGRVRVNRGGNPKVRRTKSPPRSQDNALTQAHRRLVIIQATGTWRASRTLLLVTGPVTGACAVTGSPGWASATAVAALLAATLVAVANSPAGVLLAEGVAARGDGRRESNLATHGAKQHDA